LTPRVLTVVTVRSPVKDAHGLAQVRGDLLRSAGYLFEEKDGGGGNAAGDALFTA
jgi:hypothetical protein